MPTAIVQDDCVHLSHPDENGKTHCGVEWSHDSADRIVSEAVYVDDLLGRITVEEDLPQCDECVVEGEQWAIE